MEKGVIELHCKPPSALVFMTRAFLPSPGLPRDGGLLSIVQRWAFRIDASHLAAFDRATGLSSTDGVSILYPHVLGFRLQMAVLTHRAFPLPIWKALQVRNRLFRYALIDPEGAYELETRVAGHRVMEKGVEFDLKTRLSSKTERCWESIVTYFYRGSSPGERSTELTPSAPDISAAAIVDRFRMPVGGGWMFGRLTGDYNGIHNWNWYARRLGFPGAFLHPQRALGMCLARLPGPRSAAQSLELWIKGPVFYGANAFLRALTDDGRVSFGLGLEGDPRAAIAGRWLAGGGCSGG
jgi:hypothetical protein